MRVVTWNCNGALRRKLEPLDALDADVLVIQECEDPKQSDGAYRSWAGRHAWKGYGKSKGIGIFPRKGQALESLVWPDAGYELFLPARVGGSLDILGVWTQSAQPANNGYIAQFWNYLQLNRHHLGPNSIICGDFNSNMVWDRAGEECNHSGSVKELAGLGFRSLYHISTGEAQGEERQPTFFLYRHLDRPYHIDYVFAHENRLAAGWAGTQIGTPGDWGMLSDHMPLIVDL